MLGTKRRSSVVAGIQWMRIPKKIHAPTTGVAKRTSSPNVLATAQDYAALIHMANFPSRANWYVKVPPAGGACRADVDALQATFWIATIVVSAGAVFAAGPSALSGPAGH